LAPVPHLPHHLFFVSSQKFVQKLRYYLEQFPNITEALNTELKFQVRGREFQTPVPETLYFKLWRCDSSSGERECILYSVQVDDLINGIQMAIIGKQ
jgi:hypothetical protein